MARALILVDLQGDFFPGGALGVPGGDEVLEPIDALLRDGAFDLVVATRDWHPADHGSFAAQGGPWPVHCVQGTPGAELHPAVDRARLDAVVDTGQDPHVEGYSGFQETGLAQLLADRDIDEVTLAGLATDYCVKHTALDALALGHRVTVDARAVRAVDVRPGDGEAALAEIEAAGGTVRR
jgi:nicotinamidase/pyrazinamidase